MRRKILAAASALAIATVLSAHGAAAQDQPLTPGETVTSALDASDSRASANDGGYRYETYRIEANQGQRFEVIMRSDDFDTYLSVVRPGEDEAFATDDDGLGEGTNSRLRFAADVAGTYILTARSLYGSGEGAFTLSLAERPPAAPAPAPQALRLGQTLSGVLDEQSPEFESRPYAAYHVTARANERLGLAVNSDDFDPVAVVGRVGPDGRFEELARNDDGPGRSLNSFILFQAPSAGTYELRAMPLIEGRSGAFTVAVEEAPPAPVTTPIRIGGGRVDGVLEETDAVNDQGLIADRYSFTIRQSQRVRIDMASNQFDTYLELYRSEAGGLASITTDDDGAGSGTNSRISRLLEPGDYVIEARAFGGGAGAGYTLEVTEIPPDPEPTAISFGRELRGEITERDPETDDGRRFDAYRFDGREGQRVQIIMRSGDFDTYLEIGQAGEEFVSFASDDDGLGEGTDSRLTTALPETGVYIVRASPLISDTKGLYSIEVIDRGPEPAPGSIVVGAVARGTLSENDSLADGGGYFDAYRITAKAGDKLTITMSSNDFDAFVSVGRQNERSEMGYGDGFEMLASDDDGLSDTHAKLEWTVEDDGEYVIRAGSFAPNSTGAYVLTVSSEDE